MERKSRYSPTSMCDHGFVLEISPFAPASFPVVLGDFGCDVTGQACRENSPPLVTRIARTGLVRRLPFPKKPASATKAIFSELGSTVSPHPILSAAAIAA